MNNTKKNRFITGYSGLRAIAVIGVILYHIDPSLFIGGYLGVPIFFALSGYLVTDHMLASYRNTGTYDYKRFYLNRLKKLYPQMITVLWVSGTYILLFQQNLLAKFNQIVVTNLLNIYNWWQIANGQSYFERFASNESPFVHLWTMSIDGQFYILWPLIIFIFVKFVKDKRIAFWIITALTVASAIEMAVLFKPGVDTSRIYYGTDTRFFSLGLGAMLAYVWPTGRLRARLDERYVRILDIVGGVAFAGMLVLFFSKSVNPQAAFIYRGGMFLFSVLTTIFVAIIAHPSSHWNMWMTNPIFDYIGKRSYGIYLYQFPIMIFFEDKFNDIGDHPYLYHFIEVILILLISEITYRFIERPLGKITFSKTKAYFDNIFDWNNRQWQKKVGAVIALFFLVFGSIAYVKAPYAKAVNMSKSQLAQQIAKNRAQQKHDNKSLINKFKNTGQESKSRVYREAKMAAIKHPINRKFEKYGISQLDLQLAQHLKVTAVGDSVMAGSSNNLKTLMPNLLVDADVSRQLVDTYGIVQSYKQQGALANTVLLGLGTNGQFSMGELDRMMQIIGPKRQVFWINTHIPTRQWQNPVNNMLNQAAKKYKNLTIINWYAYSAKHRSWFYGDQTHPNITGSLYYSAFVTKQIVENSKF